MNRKPRPVSFSMLRAKNGQWCWHARRGGRIVADGAETYTRERDCKRAMDSFIVAMKLGPYRVEYPQHD